ncbi:hypothetical protein FHR72_002363 [Mycolicibacterium iranicum]|uniref:DNA-binding protein n=1 Tax=Mycolicibacterium iranicum TaxID=912594 RepID=A0A839Q479_MYCIR|nr:DUF3140 domain-containing protein [Mycolicibacterium iranicum]MBB2990890.1 hypothetical protein [Mycolicibacterium iranicum]
MSDDDQKQTYDEFSEVVNMTAAELKKWLDTDDSKAVGQKSSQGGESTGHQSGRHIVDILQSKKADLTDADYKHMRKVVGYVHRHLAQGPSKDVEHSDWRYSLMNWGHDPTKS